MSGFRFRHAMAWLGVFLLSIPLQVQATEPLCAVVVIQIEQEVAFERQAFKAKMEISNALEGIDLENVNVEVLFTDAAGNPVEATSNTSSSSAAFFITVDKLEGISNISGNGTVEADTVANIEWLIIPTEAAANGTPSGELFFVGATLTYTYGGKEDQISVAPVPS